jgi:hypothetical protein
MVSICIHFLSLSLSLSLFGLHLPWLPERERERKRALADPGSVGPLGTEALILEHRSHSPGSSIHIHPCMHVQRERERKRGLVDSCWQCVMVGKRKQADKTILLQKLDRFAAD